MRIEARPAARNISTRFALAVMLAVLAGAAALAFAGERRADAASAPSTAPTADPDRTGTGAGECTGPVLTRWVQGVLASEPAWAIERARTIGRAVVDLYFRAASGVTWLVQIREGRDCGGTLGYQDRTAWVPRENFPATLLAPRPPSCDQIHRSRRPGEVASRRVRVASAGSFSAWEQQYDWRVNVTDECGNVHQEELGWVACNYLPYLNRPRLYEIHERRVRASDNRIAYRVTETFSVSCGDYGVAIHNFTASYWTYSLPSHY